MIALPWVRGEFGDWSRMQAGSDRLVAMVDEYPTDLGGGFFYVVGDGPDEESSSRTYTSVEEAIAAADARLTEKGYTFQGAN